MTEPEADYAIAPELMESRIKYLTDVIDGLSSSRKAFRDAHEQVAEVHSREPLGWFGGEGNLRIASSSFLNACEWQLRQLTDEQGDLVESLEDYESFIRRNLKIARQIEHDNTHQIQEVNRLLDEGGS